MSSAFPDRRIQSGSQIDAAACCDSCTDFASHQHPASSATVLWLQWITIAWMIVECGASLWAAAHAHSIALLAFGSDSAVELLSATVVLLQFFPRFPLNKTQASKAAGILLFLLAVVLACTSWLGRTREIDTSPIGIAITALALIAMPLLAWMKRREARRINNPALAADATQSATCAYLAGATLAGLVIFAVWHVRWVDTVAALAAIPILIFEGRRAWRGEGCGCC